MKLEKGKYYELVSAGNEKTIVYYYFNPDAVCLGFGFNTADGGGFLPVSDLTESSSCKQVFMFALKKDPSADIQDLIDHQCADGNWNYNPYMRGLANGLIMAQSVLTEEDPKLLETPYVWLRDVIEKSKRPLKTKKHAIENNYWFVIPVIAVIAAAFFLFASAN